MSGRLMQQEWASHEAAALFVCTAQILMLAGHCLAVAVADTCYHCQTPAWSSKEVLLPKVQAQLSSPRGRVTKSVGCLTP